MSLDIWKKCFRRLCENLKHRNWQWIAASWMPEASYYRYYTSIITLYLRQVRAEKCGSTPNQTVFKRPYLHNTLGPWPNSIQTTRHSRHWNLCQTSRMLPGSLLRYFFSAIFSLRRPACDALPELVVLDLKNSFGSYFVAVYWCVFLRAFASQLSDFLLFAFCVLPSLLFAFSNFLFCGAFPFVVHVLSFPLVPSGLEVN